MPLLYYDKPLPSRDVRGFFIETFLKHIYMDLNHVKSLLAMQASIHQMLAVSKGQDRLPNEEETILTTVSALKTVEHEEGFKIDENIALFICEMALNTRKAIVGPDEFLRSMFESMLK